MSDQTGAAKEKAPSLWKQIPDIWKVVTVIIAIGATAVGGYASLRDQRDALQKADGEIRDSVAALARVDEATAKRIAALEKDLGGRIDALEEKLASGIAAGDEKLGNRIDSLSNAMIRADDLDGYVVTDTLSKESCRLTMRAQMHEYRALDTAYDELLESIRIAGEAFSNRTDLKPPEEEQRDRLLRLFAKFETKKDDVRRDLRLIEERIDGCGA